MSKSGRVKKLMTEHYDEIEQLIIDLELVPLPLIPTERLKSFCRDLVEENRDTEFINPTTRITAIYLRDARRRAKERRKKFNKDSLQKISLFNR